MEGQRKKGQGNKAAGSALSFYLLPFTFFIFQAGCRNCALVEAELRDKENELREVRAELHRAESINEAFMRERHSSQPKASAKFPVEHFSSAHEVTEVVLGRQTGGYDEDSVPGDEGLQVVLEPHDPDGHAVKVPGALQVIALEISRAGLKMPLPPWEIPPENLRRTWRSGLLSTGYFVQLPWKVCPKSTKLRVVARFTLDDGRVFEADKDVTIRLTKQPRKLASPAGEDTPFETPESDTPLPEPRKSETGPAIEPTSQRRKTPVKTGKIQPTSLWLPPPSPRLSSTVKILRPVPAEPAQR